MAIPYDATRSQHHFTHAQVGYSPVESPFDGYCEDQGLPYMLSYDAGPVVLDVTFCKQLGEWHTYSRRQDENSVG